MLLCVLTGVSRGLMSSGIGHKSVHGSVRLYAKRSLSKGTPASKWKKKRKREEKIEGTDAGLINWYPGHIAKAERILKDQLKLVDIVIEARDLRIAASTAHPLVESWAGSKPRVVVYTFADSVPASVAEEWRMSSGGLFVDAKRRSGDLRQLRTAIREAGRAVNEKRAQKGILPRPARAAIIGYPNVGKSALINCLCNRRAAKAENKAGVTRQLNWIRAFEDGFELLDSPGIIPAKQVDQTSAARLAMCGDIGAASYDSTLVATSLVNVLRKLPSHYAPSAVGRLEKRSSTEFADYGDARDWFHDFASMRYHGDHVAAASVILADFRNGRLGKVALESPPRTNATRTMRKAS